jgi:hypothetical protein
MHVTFNSLSDKNKLSDKKVIKAQTRYVQLFGSQYLIYDFDTAWSSLSEAEIILSNLLFHIKMTCTNYV